MAKERSKLRAAAGSADTEPLGDTGTSLRVMALIAVAIGLLILTALACILSYPSVHSLAGQASVSPSEARIYPVIFDAMLVVAGCSVLALRGAGLVSRIYAWLCLIVLLAGLAAGSVAHAAAISLPRRPAAIAAAAIPWALVLLGFGLLLALLRYARRRRSGGRAADPSPTPDETAVQPSSAQPLVAGGFGGSPPRASTAHSFATEPVAMAGLEPLPAAGDQQDAGDQDDDGASDSDDADQRDATAQADDLDHDAGPATSPPPAPTRPIARPADLQLRARVPASRAPATSETVPSGHILPPVGAVPPIDTVQLIDTVPPSDTTTPGGLDQPLDAEPGEPPTEPLAEPPALRRPHSSPTPPDDSGN